jgi:hypothetical protein
LASTPFDLGRGFVDVFLVARGGDDISSSICEAEAQSTPDSGGPSDHNGVLAFEAENMGRHCFSASGFQFRASPFRLGTGLLRAAGQGY